MNPGWLGLFSKTYLAGIIAIVGVICLGFGVFEYVKTNQAQPQIASTPFPRIEKLITVDIEGAVVNPGIYKLPLEARINDALVAASGFDSNADAEWVEKNLNLAEKLLDGTKLYVPRKGEDMNTLGSSTVSTASNSNLISINKADSKTLESLPGIGPVTAGKIIGGRPYSSISELSTRKIINSKVYEQIKDKVTLN